jgi:uncharacterized protein YaaN involved in tellurite resistance
MEQPFALPETNAQLPEQIELTAEERDKVTLYKSKIDFESQNSVIRYGAEVQTRMVGFSENILNQLRNKDIGAVGDILSGLVAELKTFDKSLGRSRLFDFFTSLKKKIVRIKAEYSRVEKNVEQVEVQMEKHYQALSKDIILFDNLYTQNEQYFRDITLYIRAGEEKLAEMKESISDEPAYRFEKKLHDLKISRTIALQLAPQIRLLQNNSAILMERIQSSLVNTLPLWRNQMVLSLGLIHSRQALEAQHAINEATNSMLKRNSEMLRDTSVKIARENERSIVDIETLKKANDDLFATIDSVLDIQRESRLRRKAVEQELADMENEMSRRIQNLNPSR